MTETDPSNLGPISDGRKSADERFAAGNAGGLGRPVGLRNRASLLLDALAEGDAEAIAKAYLEKAKGGDMRAAEFVLARVWPARKGRAVTFDLPPVQKAADLVSAVASVASAMAAGDLTPDEAAAVSTVLETQRRAIETTDLEARLAALEAAKGV